MIASLRPLRRHVRGVAAVEFALTFPIILYLFAGVTDFGLYFYRDSCISTAMAAAAQYALVQDESGGVVAANVQTVLQNAVAQNMRQASVTTTAACYCVSGSATTAWNTNTPVSCNGSCATGAQKYIYLTVTYTNQALMPGLSKLHPSTPIPKQMWLPLQ